ncbi:unnamed protein product [Hymenolepis diminuta]|uniref:RanBD1 domain-containing protein n=1 Tax=Hymenolepis diminuta TaxID=6216 RepID=A0A0R3SUD3_HYMDI|nr:unnamed protein product [Hymenolepis diminuta]
MPETSKFWRRDDQKYSGGGQLEMRISARKDAKKSNNQIFAMKLSNDDDETLNPEENENPVELMPPASTEASLRSYFKRRDIRCSKSRRFSTCPKGENLA